MCRNLKCKWQNFKTSRRKQKVHDLGLGKEFINTTVIHRRKKLIGWTLSKFKTSNEKRYLGNSLAVVRALCFHC